jgi:hypothetical protein
LLSIGKFTRRVQQAEWHVGVCSNTPERAAAGCGTGSCLAGAFWLDDPRRVHGSSASTWHDPFQIIDAHGGFSNYSDPAICATLADLDEGIFAFFMNRKLFEHAASIDIYANEYLLWSAKAVSLRADAPSARPETPWTFTDAEMSDEWVRVMPRGAGHFDFSAVTPHRVWEAGRPGHSTGVRAESTGVRTESYGSVAELTRRRE